MTPGNITAAIICGTVLLIYFVEVFRGGNKND
jgi:hypothetical protein